MQGFSTVPYQGNLTPVSAAIGGPGAACVPTVFDWVNTYSSGAVKIDFRSASAGSRGTLQPLLMVYVDNSQNPNTVFITFDDTQYTLTILPGEVGYFPLITASLYCTVYNGLVYSAATSGSTSILFCNFATPGFATDNITIPFNRVSSIAGSSATRYGPNTVGNLKGSASHTYSGVGPNSFTVLPAVAGLDQIITSFDLPLTIEGTVGACVNFTLYQANTPSNILFTYIVPYCTPISTLFTFVLASVANSYIYLANANGDLIMKFSQLYNQQNLLGTVYGMNFQYLQVPKGSY